MEVGRTHRALGRSQRQGQGSLHNSGGHPRANSSSQQTPSRHPGASYLNLTAVTQPAPSTVRIWTFLTDLPSHRSMLHRLCLQWLLCMYFRSLGSSVLSASGPGPIQQACVNSYSIHGIGGQGCFGISQRLKDIIRSCPLSEVQGRVTLTPKGRPASGDFLIPSASPSGPYLRHLATVCLGGILRN